MRKFSFFSMCLFPFFGIAQWEQLGQDLIGSTYTPNNNHETYFGHSIAFSDDGATMVVGAPGSSCTTCYFQSYARVYKNVEGNWIQFGDDILGGNPFMISTIPPRAGFSVDISGDGNVIAISEPYYYEVFEDQIYKGGRVRVFQISGNNYVQLGDSVGELILNLSGGIVDDSFGYSISLSNDGKTLAVGSRFFTPTGAGSTAGKVSVFQYDSSGEWNQIGSTIDGLGEYEYLGSEVELSGDGTLLAIAAPGNANYGEIQLFELLNNEWSLLSKINGEVGRRIGNTFSLSNDGSTLVLSSSTYSVGFYTNEGNVRVYTKNNGVFTETASITGQAGQRLGGKVTISENGQVMNVTSGAFSGAYMNQIYSYQLINGSWGQVGDAIYFNIPNGNFYYQELISNADGSMLGIGNYDYKSGDVIYNEGRVLTYQNCSLSSISVSASQSSSDCTGGSAIVSATIFPEYYAANGTVNWYLSEDAVDPIFTGTEFETPSLNESTSYWVEALTATGCASERVEVLVTVSPTPELSLSNTNFEICQGTTATLSASSMLGEINWYSSENSTEILFSGTSFETSPLTETTSFWVEAETEAGCKSERVEIVVTVNPLPILEAETTYAICTGNEASLYASSPSNVIFWYANEADTEYLYHGNLFVTEVLTENTTYWVEAYNLSTGCTSERIEVTVTVGEALAAPIAESTQYFVAGMTLADLEVEHTGTLRWYADAQLTQELPETTLVIAGTTYYVTQSGVGCESAATAILVDTFLGNGNLNSDKFAYYPNPVKDVLNFKGKEVIKSVQVFDLSGKLILNQNSNSISNINLSILPKGTYVVKAVTEKVVNTFKIVKN